MAEPEIHEDIGMIKATLSGMAASMDRMARAMEHQADRVVQLENKALTLETQIVTVRRVATWLSAVFTGAGSFLATVYHHVMAK